MNKTMLSIVVLVVLLGAVGVYVGTRPNEAKKPDITLSPKPTLAIGNAGVYGGVLTDSEGRTLYLFTKDTTGTTTCYNQCAVNWPPLLVRTPGDLVSASAVTGAVGTIRRVEGTLQVTMNGMPLYYYIKDVKPGDTLGQGVGNVWYVLGADGAQKGSPAATATTTSYTLADVAKHATEKDCWMVVHGNVYDVTKAIPNHAGGKAILEGCGKDATTLFETRPMGSGTPHSDKARGFLAGLAIGTLKQ